MGVNTKYVAIKVRTPKQARITNFVANQIAGTQIRVVADYH